MDLKAAKVDLSVPCIHFAPNAMSLMLMPVEKNANYASDIAHNRSGLLCMIVAWSFRHVGFTGEIKDRR